MKTARSGKRERPYPGETTVQISGKRKTTVSLENSNGARLRDWPEGERPREKLMRIGASVLSDSELISILLRTGSGSQSAVGVAQQLMIRFERLSVLSRKNVQEIQRIKGIGITKASTLVAAFELGRRSMISENGGLKRITCSADVARRFTPTLRDLRREVFLVVLLDSANQIIRDVTVTAGTLNASVVHPREVFKPAIDDDAASVILLHNHPSGNPEPSSEDIQITRQMVKAGDIIGIRVLDHIIIAGNQFTSFIDRGLI